MKTQQPKCSVESFRLIHCQIQRKVHPTTYYRPGQGERKGLWQTPDGEDLLWRMRQEIRTVSPGLEARTDSETFSSGELRLVRITPTTRFRGQVPRKARVLVRPRCILVGRRTRQEAGFPRKMDIIFQPLRNPGDTPGESKSSDEAQHDYERAPK